MYYVLYVYIYTCIASNIPGASNKLEQIQHRLMSFDDQWSILRRWYLRFRNLGTVNSNLSTEAVYSTARDKIQEVINKVWNKNLKIHFHGQALLFNIPSFSVLHAHIEKIWGSLEITLDTRKLYIDKKVYVLWE